MQLRDQRQEVWEDVPGVRDTVDDRIGHGLYYGQQVDHVSAIVCCVYEHPRDYGYKVEKTEPLSAAVRIHHFGCRTFMRERYPHDSTAAGAGVGIVFLVVSRVTDESLGYGDSILILIMGGFLGFWNILSLLVAAFSMAALFSIFMLLRKKFHRKSAFPFVPFLTAAYIGGMIIGAY